MQPATPLSPFAALSSDGRAALQRAASEWAQLRVLVDKLQRLERMAAVAGGDAEAARAAEAALVKELRCWRSWDPAHYPAWLAFELDGSLQIRPEQHALADCVMRNADAIVQMNSARTRRRRAFRRSLV